MLREQGTANENLTNVQAYGTTAICGTQKRSSCFSASVAVKHNVFPVSELCFTERL